MPPTELEKGFPEFLREKAIAIAHALHGNIVESVRDKNTASR